MALVIFACEFTADAIQVCVNVGACYESQFQLKLTPTNSVEDKWYAHVSMSPHSREASDMLVLCCRTDSCFVCRLFASELEDSASLRAMIDDTIIEGMIRSSCGKLVCSLCIVFQSDLFVN
jgi:hypothetical protein